jgi:hypothetical protein
MAQDTAGGHGPQFMLESRHEWTGQDEWHAQQLPGSTCWGGASSATTSWASLGTSSTPAPSLLPLASNHMWLHSLPTYVHACTMLQAFSGVTNQGPCGDWFQVLLLTAPAADGCSGVLEEHWVAAQCVTRCHQGSITLG